mmetsp:Transcript_5625/g.12737  ORF Transcript_5625/g.12737 Transcript_5625/m.12737 type:complete len:100 (-) Transcript_5625:57-356(-)
MASGTVGNRLRTEPKTLKVTIDITGDLAMCAMVLGKEGMSSTGVTCARLPRKNYSDHPTWQERQGCSFQSCTMLSCFFIALTRWVETLSEEETTEREID